MHLAPVVDLLCADPGTHRVLEAAREGDPTVDVSLASEAGQVTRGRGEPGRPLRLDVPDPRLWSPDDLRPRDGDGEMYPGNFGDKSSALLLKHKGGARASESVVAVTIAHAPFPPGASALSLSTLPIAGALGLAADEQQQQPRKEITSTERWHGAFDFLTDGARGVRAFSRPYPTATVGALTLHALDRIKSEYLKTPGALVHA